MPTITIPPQILDSLNAGAHLILSASGGKDSQAMSRALVDLHKVHNWQGRVVMVHADLGAMERSETRAFIELEAARLGVELVILDEKCLLEHIEARYERLVEQGRDVVPFPDAKNRYCTSDLKRNPISKWIRNTFEFDAQVVCAVGLRADESSARAKKPVHRLRVNTNAPTKRRIVYDWHTILDWTLADVWSQLGYTLEALEVIQTKCNEIAQDGLNAYAYLFNIGFDVHPAYGLGNERLSCAMCILGCTGDIVGGAHNRPDTFARLVDLEIKSGKSFKPKSWLAAQAPDLLTASQIEALNTIDINILEVS